MDTIVQKYMRLSLSEHILYKATGQPEMAQMVRIEARLRQLLSVAWDKRAKQATSKAAAMAKNGSSPKNISAAINGVMRKWAGDIGKPFGLEFERTYILGRELGLKKATGQYSGEIRYSTPKFEEIEKAVAPSVQASFGLVDKAAVDALRNHQLFWIGTHYDRSVSDAIAQVTRETIAEAGGSSVLAGQLISQRIDETLQRVAIPERLIGTQKQYFESLAANAMTTARVHGSLRSFAEIGVSEYRISNPLDHRTCPRCGHMEGKVFMIQQGMDQMNAELNAKTPEQAKAIHPWMNSTELRAISPVAGPAGAKDAKALSEAGLSLPTYHGRCRCTVDVTTDSMRYENLIPVPASVAPSTFKRASTPTSWLSVLASKEKKAFSVWGTSKGHDDIVKFDGGEADAKWLRSAAGRKAEADLISMRDGLARAPIYDGTVYRGLDGLSEAEATQITTKGTVIQQDSISSWNKSRAQIVESLGSQDGTVTLKMKTTERSFDISKLSSAQEGEVVVEKGKRMVVKSVKKLDGIQEITLGEIK